MLRYNDRFESDYIDEFVDEWMDQFEGEMVDLASSPVRFRLLAPARTRATGPRPPDDPPPLRRTTRVDLQNDTIWAIEHIRRAIREIRAPEPTVAFYRELGQAARRIGSIPARLTSHTTASGVRPDRIVDINRLATHFRVALRDIRRAQRWREERMVLGRLRDFLRRVAIHIRDTAGRLGEALPA